MAVSVAMATHCKRLIHQVQIGHFGQVILHKTPVLLLSAGKALRFGDWQKASHTYFL